MTIPGNTTKVVLEGHLPNGEMFNTAFWLAGEPPTSAVAANTLASAISAAFIAGLAPAGSPGALLRSTSGYDKCKVYAYPSGGPTAFYVGEAPMVRTGSGSTAILPNQCALVLTLRTGFAGRRWRGRMYVPINGQALQADSQLDQTTLDGFTTWWKNFFQSVNAISPGGVVSVVSQVGTGNTASVTTVTADSRLDIQRRRASGETELRQSTATV